MEDKFDVVIMDSGVGGLTIFENVRQLMPHVNVSYLADHAFFPYGTKSEDEVLERIEDLVSKIQSKFSAKVFIVACNTASTVVLPRLRTKFPGTHFIGVVPAIKPAASLSSTKKIALLATPATIEREYIDDLINSYASHCEIIRVGDSRLAQQAELKLKGDTVDLQTLRSILEPLAVAGVDTVVLGCTHYPILKKELEKCLPSVSRWVDSGEAIARRLNFICSQLDIERDSKSIFLTTGSSFSLKDYDFKHV